jgi:hypothetical protein
MVRMANLENVDALLTEQKRVESMLAMLVGNTEPGDIKILRRQWLQPILERLSDLRQVENPSPAGPPSAAIAIHASTAVPAQSPA